MTDLEARLRGLRPTSRPGPSADELRQRAARRRHGRRLRATAMLVVLLLGVGVFAVQDQGDDSNDIVTGPASESTTVTTSNVGSSIGEVGTATVEVQPRAGLLDGDLVEVRVSGLAELSGATILQCAGDVTEADAQRACDSLAVDVPGLDHPFPVPAAEEQTVSVARVIHITRGSPDPNVVRPYDCATEPAGCVLAVGPYELPARAVLVPLDFEAAAPTSPTASIDPAENLTNGYEVDLTAQDLRPNATVQAKLCESSPRQNCSIPTSVATDASGALSTRITVHAAIYGGYGRSDCVTTACDVVIANLHGQPLLEIPVRFADGVVAPTPRLEISPPGPYSDRQVVEVRGFNFPPGIDLNGDLGQCPADKDTAVEERCGYDLAEPTIVDSSGRFTATVRLYDSLALTGSCVDGPGCVLAWVIQNGPIAASIPLEFRQ